VGGDGVGLLYEDPAKYDSLGCSLEVFLKMLVDADTAALRDGLEAGRASAATLVGERRAQALVRLRMST